MATEQKELGEPTAEALKQRRKREKKNKDDERLGIEAITVEMASGFKAGLKRLMAEHGFKNRQEVYQTLLRNAIDADFSTASQMLRCVTTPFVVSEEMSRKLDEFARSQPLHDPEDDS